MKKRETTGAPAQPTAPDAADANTRDEATSEAREATSEAHEATSAAGLDRPSRALAEHLSAFSRRAHRPPETSDASGGRRARKPAERRRPAIAELPTDTARGEPKDDAGATERAPTPKRHRFPRKSILLADQVLAIERHHRRFAQGATPALRALMRTDAELELETVRQCAYADFTADLRGPTSLRLVDYTPEEAPLVAEMPLDLLYPILERLLGSAADPSPPPPGPPTRVEQAVAGVFFRHVFRWLAESWRDARPDARFELGESEHNPLLMQVFEPGEPVVLLQFALTVFDVRGPLRVCVPTRRFERVIERFVDHENGRRHTPADEARVLQRLKAASVAVSAELGPVPLALEDVLALEPGDMIDTGVRRSDEIGVHLDGRPVLRGRAYVDGPRIAVEIAGEPDAVQELFEPPPAETPPAEAEAAEEPPASA